MVMTDTTTERIRMSWPMYILGFKLVLTPLFVFGMIAQQAEFAPPSEHKLIAALGLTETLVWIFIAYMFFTKRRAFPMAFALIMTVSLIGACVELGQSTLGSRDASMRNFLTTAVNAIIWIPYLFNSSRVKQVFTRRFGQRYPDPPAVDSEAGS